MGSELEALHLANSVGKSSQRNFIPVCVPLLGERELEYVSDCIKGGWISSSGKYVNKFEEGFAKYCGCKYGIATTNGTTAIHLALACLNLQKDDEVIVPSFTMIGSVLPIIYCGAKPVLVDADPLTGNMDTESIESKITKRTKAILPVHIYGNPCNMDQINSLARDYHLVVIEDAAEAHGATFKGKRTGGLGDMGCFSFFANKIITTGEGGMVVTNNEEFANKAAALRNLAFPKGKRVYSHDAVGFNYRMTNIQAALGLAQLERIDELVNRRKSSAKLYDSLLRSRKGIRFFKTEEGAESVCWMYSILIEDNFGMTRDQLMDKLEKEGIETRSFFISMHRQPVFGKMGLFQGEKYPVSDDLSRKGMYLPSSSGLTPEEIETVCEAIIN